MGLLRHIRDELRVYYTVGLGQTSPSSTTTVPTSKRFSHRYLLARLAEDHGCLLDYHAELTSLLQWLFEVMSVR